MPVKYWMHPSSSSSTPSTRIFNASSRFIVRLVAVTAKLWTEYLSTTRVYNKETLRQLVTDRSPGRGLVTVCNHDSCVDDPVTIAGTLKLSQMKRDLWRWSLVADEICFSKLYHSLAFSLGRCVPVVRGEGVYQKPMDFVKDKLDLGDWVHVFPEGKVNLTKEVMRLKWGVGRLVAEAKKCPVVLPYFHYGMDDVLPTRSPYIPNPGKKITVLVGTPIDFSEELKKLQDLKKTKEEIRKYITDRIQDELYALKPLAKALHFTENS